MGRETQDEMVVVIIRRRGTWPPFLCGAHTAFVVGAKLKVGLRLTKAGRDGQSVGKLDGAEGRGMLTRLVEWRRERDTTMIPGGRGSGEESNYHDQWTNGW